MGRTAKTVLRNSRQEFRPPRKVCPLCFEGDHIGGANHVPHIIVEFCQAHHAVLGEKRLAAGAEMHEQRHPLNSVEMTLRSLAVTGHAIAWAVEKLSEALEFCADRLKRAAR
ncbi:MAG: hypothetical protein ACR2IF_18915 [Terriglobales bacterium]